MGGGAHPPHPKWVWSPAGGWQWQDVWQPVVHLLPVLACVAPSRNAPRGPLLRVILS